MRVRLLFFAILRDLIGVDERELVVADGASAGAVWSELVREFPSLTAFERAPLIAVNESYADPSLALSDGDVVAFIPPVSGG